MAFNSRSILLFFGREADLHKLIVHVESSAFVYMYVGGRCNETNPKSQQCISKVCKTKCDLFGYTDKRNSLSSMQTLILRQIWFSIPSWFRDEQDGVNGRCEWLPIETPMLTSFQIGASTSYQEFPKMNHVF